MDLNGPALEIVPQCIERCLRVLRAQESRIRSISGSKFFQYRTLCALQAVIYEPMRVKKMRPYSRTGHRTVAMNWCEHAATCTAPCIQVYASGHVDWFMRTSVDVHMRRRVHLLVRRESETDRRTRTHCLSRNIHTEVYYYIAQLNWKRRHHFASCTADFVNSNYLWVL